MSQIIVDYDYTVVPTVKAFTLDKHFIKGIMGPFGSGKSSGCVMDLFNTCVQQKPDPNGIRRTRFAVVRNSYIQLKDTTKRTIDEWIRFAKWKESEHIYTIDIKLEDGTYVHSEWLLRALDRPDQVANLLSLELTGAWLNEARELPKEVFDNIQFRVGRYPKKIYNNEGIVVLEPTWKGVILDTNPPDFDHWFPNHFENLKPDNSVLFKQPSGLSDEAENLKYLDGGRDYYVSRMAGKDEEFIKIYIHGEYGYLQEGRPVFSNFKDSMHVHSETLKPLPNQTLIIGMDMGLSPAAVITQMDPRGRVLVLDEITTEYMAAKEFAENHLRPLLRTKYMNADFIIIGDPAGNARSQVDARTVYQELRFQGLKARAAKTNALQARISAVNAFLMRLIEGKPAFVLSPQCKKLRSALNGEYHYRRMMVSAERYTDVPEKNMASHVADALQYACLEHETGFSAYGKGSILERNKQVEPVLSAESWT